MRSVMPIRRRLALALLTVAAGLAAPAAAQAVEPGLVVGLRTGGENVDQVDRAARSGSEWLRIFVDWSTAEQRPGELNPFYLNEFDGRVNRARAAGMKVLMVVTRSPSWASGSADPNRPPADAGTYASFLRRYAERYRGRVAAWEIWNEPDEAPSWAPAPDAARYTDLLRAAYPAVKQGDPGARVVLGGLVGNDYRFLEQVYGSGGKGAFDAVGTHTDTACLTSPPEEQYREPDGRIGRFSFTGYREVRRTMLANGDDKPVWLTEIGWSTLTKTCRVGGRAGTKPSGVSEADQARYLTKAYRCLQNDPFVAVAMWFSLQDVDRSDTRYDHRLGLLRDDGSRKPAYGAFRDFATDKTRPGSNCGFATDGSAPKVRILAPTANQPYVDRIVVSARATDAQGVNRMELYADGVKVPGSQKGGRFRLEWNGASKLANGPHTLTVKARDPAGNVGESSIAVVKGDAASIKVPPARVAFTVRRLGGRRVQLAGRVTSPGSPVKPKGRVRMFLDIRRGKGWKPYSRYTKGVARSFRFSVRVKKAGMWRVRARYLAERPHRDVVVRTRTLGRFR